MALRLTERWEKSSFVKYGRSSVRSQWGVQLSETSWNIIRASCRKGNAKIFVLKLLITFYMSFWSLSFHKTEQNEKNLAYLAGPWIHFIKGQRPEERVERITERSGVPAEFWDQSEAWHLLLGANTRRLLCSHFATSFVDTSAVHRRLVGDNVWLKSTTSKLMCFFTRLLWITVWTIQGRCGII